MSAADFYALPADVAAELPARTPQERRADLDAGLAALAALDAEDDAEPVVDVCRCGDLISDHIGHLPCVFGAPAEVKRSWRDLPIAGWAWAGDAVTIDR